MEVIKLPNHHKVLLSQRTYFFSQQTKDYSFRKKQLKRLKQMLKQNEKAIYHALKQDLNKSSYEALTTELGILYLEIDFAIKHLKDWMKPEKVPTPITHKGSESYILKEPYGVVLIIAPWNYPLQLSLAPAIGAIAAGNTVILKPSEYSPHVSVLLKELVSHYFPSHYFAVIEGDQTTTQQLLNEQFDYIFFTGSTHVGKIIMEKASQFLTPVTLELGGKSPAIVDQDAHLQLAAKRMIWGKFTNAGQTCVAPDYVYVHEKIKKKFIKQLIKYIRSFYGKQPLENQDFVRMITEKHFNRLTGLLKNRKHIIHGGHYNQAQLKIEPTLLDDVTWDDPVMQEEIFGPILPILTFSNMGDVISAIQSKDKPLAVYYFGENKKNEQRVLEQLSFGGGCINDTLYHLANPHLPFGGVGASGLGHYHGAYSFETFTHKKSILKQTTRFDLPFRYPNGKIMQQLIKKIMK